MIGIVGIIVVFVMVFGGYLAAGGKMAIILKSLPFELTMIGGAGLGAFLISNSGSAAKHTVKDLGKVFKVKIRHDNSMFGPAWFLDKVEVIDPVDNETFTFYCERWLAKNKEDCKIERSLYVKVR